MVTALEGDAGKPAPRTHQGLVTARCLGSGVFRGGVTGSQCQWQSGLEVDFMPSDAFCADADDSKEE